MDEGPPDRARRDDCGRLDLLPNEGLPGVPVGAGLLPVRAAPATDVLDDRCSRFNQRRLTDGRGLNSLSDWPVDGILSHAAGPTSDGWRVVDVWDSEEPFERFGSVIGPMLQEVGFPGEPQGLSLHNFVS